MTCASQARRVYVGVVTVFVCGGAYRWHSVLCDSYIGIIMAVELAAGDAIGLLEATCSEEGTVFPKV